MIAMLTLITLLVSCSAVCLCSAAPLLASLDAVVIRTAKIDVTVSPNQEPLRTEMVVSNIGTFKTIK